MDPVNFPNPRFQIFWVKYDVDKLSNGKKCLLYGYIAASDYNVSGPDDGWLPFNLPQRGYSFLFDREWYDPVLVKNTDRIHSLINPKTNRSVSALSSVLHIMVDLYAFEQENKECFTVARERRVVNLTEPENINTFFTTRFNGKDGCLDMSFMVLTDAVDADLEITFHSTDSFVCGESIRVQLIAYYGSESDGPLPLENSRYCVTLFQTESATLLDDFKFPIDNSVLAVPAKGSLVIRAYILDLSFCNTILLDFFKLPAKQQGSSSQCIEGKGCSCELKVTWKYKADT